MALMWLAAVIGLSPVTVSGTALPFSISGGRSSFTLPFCTGAARNHSTASGTRASRLERASAKEHLGDVRGHAGEQTQLDERRESQHHQQRAPITMHMPGRRSGEPVRRRS